MSWSPALPGAGALGAGGERHSRPTVWRRPSPFVILSRATLRSRAAPLGSAVARLIEAGQRRIGVEAAAERQDVERARGAGIEHPDEGGARREVGLEGRG